MTSRRRKKAVIELAESQTLPQEGEISDQEGQEYESPREQEGASGKENNSPEFIKWKSGKEQEFKLRKFQLETQTRQMEIREKAEQEKRQLEAEAQKRQLELEIREKEMQHQLEMRKLEMASLNSNNSNSTNEGISKIKKFPQFKKGDCPESFLILFERACWDYGVTEQERMLILRSFISAEMSEIYVSMSEDQARNYEIFKKLVYSRFGITSEKLRQKFRQLSKKPDESYSQFGANLVRYLQKWLEQSQVRTLEDMQHLIELEQFYSALPAELRYLVRDKQPKTVQQTNESADLISEIRNSKYSEVKLDRNFEERKRETRDFHKTNKNTDGSHFRERPSEQYQQKGKSFEGKGDRNPYNEQRNLKTCFGCGKPDHFISNCEFIKNKEMGQQKTGGVVPKKMYCIQKQDERSEIN
ncbi:uncharacterized protein LOC144585766 [Pogona vitticeps]